MSYETLIFLSYVIGSLLIFFDDDNAYLRWRKNGVTYLQTDRYTGWPKKFATIK